MIILRSPKGWSGPKTVDGKKSEGSWRSHQVPFSDMDKPEHVQLLAEWMTVLPAGRTVRCRLAG